MASSSQFSTATETKKAKTKAKSKGSTKGRHKKQREIDRQRSLHQNWIRDQKRKRGLHPAAQWKRILSHLDFWWSQANLPADDFLKKQLRQYQGWCRVSTLLKFKKFQHWVDERLLLDAVSSTEGAKKWVMEQRHVNNDANQKAVWMVRRKNVTPKLIDQWEQELLEQQEQLRQEEEEQNISDDGDSTTNSKTKKKKSVKTKQQSTTSSSSSSSSSTKQITSSQPSLPRYKIPNREIIIVRKPSQLSHFCQKLRQSIHDSVEKWGDTVTSATTQHHPASVMGLDVEYATLELDIRPSLPALLQLAAPGPTGVVGLIWLDKFPNFGRNVLQQHVPKLPEHYNQQYYVDDETGEMMDDGPLFNDSSYHHYEPLRQLLLDASIRKVGVGVHGDVRNLLAWWGVDLKNPDDDETMAPYFINGVSDIVLDEIYPATQNDSKVAAILTMIQQEQANQKRHLQYQSRTNLQDLCALVLQKQLKKKKGKKASKVKDLKKRRKLKPIHWRADQLTPDMKDYAAQDAAAVVDIYMKLHGFVE